MIICNCVFTYALSTPIEFLSHDISYDENNTQNKFFTKNTLWYLKDIDSNIVTGFVKYNGKFYYFITEDGDKNGALAVQKTFKTRNGYYSTTRSGRVLKSNDKIEKNEKYYDFKLKKFVYRPEEKLFDFEITEPGVYRSVDDDIYGFVMKTNVNGEELIPATGLQIIDGYYYIFDEDGKAKTGVVKYGDSLHYCLPYGDRKGIVAIGEFVENGRIYTTDMDGYIVSIR